MNNLKVDIINDAYGLLVISGITTQPTPGDLEIALYRLENMAAEFQGRNICTGYNFEDKPDANSLHGLEKKFTGPFASNLAFRLCSYFGKTPSASLFSDMQQGYSFLSSNTAVVKEVLPPSRQPIGSGNSRVNRYRRFYNESEQAPTGCETVKMKIGDVNDFTEHFDSFLRYDGETISSYTIEAETGVTLMADSLESPDVLYTVRADGAGGNLDGWYKIKIVATTSIGRIETRIINFVFTVAEI